MLDETQHLSVANKDKLGNIKKLLKHQQNHKLEPKEVRTNLFPHLEGVSLPLSLGAPPLCLALLLPLPGPVSPVGQAQIVVGRLG